MPGSGKLQVFFKGLVNGCVAEARVTIKQLFLRIHPFNASLVSVLKGNLLQPLVQYHLHTLLQGAISQTAHPSRGNSFSLRAF